MENIDVNNCKLDLDDMSDITGGRGVFAGLTADELYDVLIRICETSGVAAAFQTAIDKYGASKHMIASCQNYGSDSDKLKMLASSIIRNPKA